MRVIGKTEKGLLILFKNKCRNGKGKYTYNNGDVYEGEFLNDSKHG